jgi:hypothetical protein
MLRHISKTFFRENFAKVTMMFTKNVYLDKKLSIIIDYIKSVKGIEYVKPLNNNEKKTILNLEEETMKKFSP